MALGYLIEFRLVPVRTRRRSTASTPMIRVNMGGHKGHFPNLVYLIQSLNRNPYQSLYKEILIVIHVTLFSLGCQARPVLKYFQEIPCMGVFNADWAFVAGLQNKD